ncbi:MAG TPA: hypothetical protein VGP80_02605 [Gemmatimonadales bacterium]|jgi:hypothetical protein|nr:hypothetical protein [Gemmatimonadales bacterium]
MIAALDRLGVPSRFTQALADWALRARTRELYDLVAFGLVAIPLGFLGDPAWWLMAAAPLGISALGGWSLLERRARPSSLTLRIAQGLLATVVFVTALTAVLVLFFILMSPPPTL